MTVGIVNIIAVKKMSVMTYVMETYELAKDQAFEVLKGVHFEPRTEHLGENGMRQIVFTCDEHFEIVIVQEIEVGIKVLEVV